MTLRNSGSGFLVLFVLSLAPLFAHADASSTPDTTPPVITAPAPQSFTATTFPASPTLVPATATDDTDPNPVITYAPLTFPEGTTTVTWTATDSSGNFATTTSDVGLIDNTPPAPPSPVTAHLEIDTATTTLFSGPITVTACPITPGNATLTVSAYCAIQQSGVDAQWSTFGDDSFLDSIDGVANDFGASQFWGWWSNLEYGEIALNKHLLIPGEKVLVAITVFPLRISASTVTPDASSSVTILVEEFGFQDYNPTWLPSASSTVTDGSMIFTTNASGTVEITPTSLTPLTLSAAKTGFISSDPIIISPVAVTPPPPPPPPPPSGGSGGGGFSHSSLNIQSALAFLSGNQNADGSYGYFSTDWVALAFAAADPGIAKEKLKTYLTTATPSMASVSDYERHAIALEAMGIDPYSGTAVDYITPIVNSFDGTQIGDVNSFRDDIFAFFALLHAGYRPSDPILLKSGAFIISKQLPNGSWEDADTTAAAIQALGSLFGPTGFSARTLGTSLGKAQGYLASTQQSDGGWSNIDSTTWVQTMINAMNALDPSRASLWPSTSGLYPTDSIARAQFPDGGVRPTTDAAYTRVWSTSYAVVAASGKNWLSILKPFHKPAAVAPTTSGSGSSGSSGGLVLGEATSTLATSTPTSATSTAAIIDEMIASSTPGVATTSPQALVKPKNISKRHTAVPVLKATPKPDTEDGPPAAPTAATAATPNLVGGAIYAVFRFFTKLFGFL